jgi:hypothetical protein
MREIAPGILHHLHEFDSIVFDHGPIDLDHLLRCEARDGADGPDMLHVYTSSRLRVACDYLSVRFALHSPRFVSRSCTDARTRRINPSMASLRIHRATTTRSFSGSQVQREAFACRC